MELAIIASIYNKNNNQLETIDAIKEAGFKNIFLEWYNDEWKISQEEQIEYAKKIGLNIIFLHLGYKHINSLWRRDINGYKIVGSYKKDLKACNKYGINLVIMHLTSGKTPPSYNMLGIKRLNKIIDYAKEMNIKIAFENNKIPGYLEYLFSNIKKDNIGICYDSGHCHANFDDKFNFEYFKNKILAVHLHDNDKTWDQHLIPFDGTIDWDFTINKLKECNYNGPITMESTYKEKRYLNISIQKFYQKAYNAGEKLLDIYNKNKV